MRPSRPAERQPSLIEQAGVRPLLRWAGQALALMAAFIELIVPIAVAYGVSQVVEGESIGVEVWTPMLIAVLASGMFAAGQVVLLTRVAAREMLNLRLAVASRLVGLLPRTIEKRGVGEATALYSHYASELEPLLTADRIRRRTAVATVAGCLALMVGFEWRLTLALLLALIVAGLIIAVVLKPVQQRASEGLNALADTSADLQEYLRSIRSATVYGLGAGYRRRFDARLREVARTERHVGHAQALVDLVVKTTSMLLLISLGALGAYLVSIDNMSIANLSGFLGALAILLAPAAKYAELVQHVRTARAAEARINELPPEESPLAHASDRVPASHVVPIEVTDAVSAPAEGVSVGPASLRAQRGELVCLVGPSGSGKTTLLSAIAGFATISSGRISIGGRSLARWSAPELWRAIGYVEQGTPTLGATVRTFLAPDEAHPPDEMTLHRLLSDLDLYTRLGDEGIDTPLERGGTSLSGGERQRLSIVRALASDRPLLLFDEPTAHLDVQTEAMVLEAIDRYRRDRVVIVASHSEQVIMRADSVVRLDPTSQRTPRAFMEPSQLNGDGGRAAASASAVGT